MSDRSKLAEAVFYGHVSVNGKLREDFDPFTDANDAYVVHQHFIESEQREEYLDALFELVVRPGHQYSRAQDVTPWHWPKAALKVIATKQEGET